MHPYREPGLNEAGNEVKPSRWEALRRAVGHAVNRGRIAYIFTHSLGVAIGLVGASVAWAHVLGHLTVPVISSAVINATHPPRHEHATGAAAMPPMLIPSAQLATFDAPPRSLFAVHQMPPAAATAANEILRYEQNVGADMVLQQSVLSNAARVRLSMSGSWHDGVTAEHLSSKVSGPVVLQKVEPRSRFDLLGFRTGDVLLSINGIEVDDRSWWNLLPAVNPTRTNAVTFEFLRGGARQALEIQW